MKSSRPIAVAAAILAGLALPVQALITPDGSVANSAADATYSPTALWDNVGNAGDSSGEYLGNGWIITANHVTRTDDTHINFSLTFGVTTHTWVGTGFQLGTHDIFLAHLAPDGSSNLPDAYGATGVAIASATPAIGTAVTLSGYGRTISSTTYMVPGDPWTTSVETDPDAVAVYGWGGTLAKTWGTNTIWGTSAAGSTIDSQTLASQTVAGDNALAVDLSSTRHASLPESLDAATPFEAVAAVNDSGAGMFVNVGGNWQLAGLIDTVNAWDGQPANTSTVDVSTFAIDLASYSTEINDAIAVPEPSAVTLFGVAPLLFGRSLLRRIATRLPLN